MYLSDSDEAKSSINNDAVHELPSSTMKFNLKYDSTHGNDAKSLLKEYIENSKLNLQNDMHCVREESRNDVESESEEFEENNNDALRIETPLSWSNCESKEDYDSVESSPNEEEKSENNKEQSTNNVINQANHAKRHHPRKRSKSCLSVRTLEESLSSSILSTNSNKDLSVTFSKLQIREYQIQLVNNPACTGGPPIGIGWKFEEKEDMNLTIMADKEKKYIKIDDKPPGPYDKIYIKPYDRLSMLKKNGYTDTEIVECILEVKETQRLRNKSATASDKDEEKMEMVNKVSKKFKKLIRSKDKKKQDKVCKSFYQK